MAMGKCSLPMGKDVEYTSSPMRFFPKCRKAAVTDIVLRDLGLTYRFVGTAPRN